MKNLYWIMKTVKRKDGGTKKVGRK